MRRLLLLAALLAHPALAFTPQQQAVLAPRASCQVPAGAVPGDPICPEIMPDGWHLRLTVLGAAPVRTATAYALDPAGTPRASLAVVSPGFDATGAATTVGRTVIGTIPQRLAWPNDAVMAEDQTPLGVRITLALSDWVNAGDTATLLAGAGLYASGGVSSTGKAGLAVVNRSAKRHDRPICAFVSESWLRVTPGSTATVEATCLHARPRAGRQVAAVVFTARDSAGNAASCTSATMTQSTRIAGGNPVPVYACGITIPASGWTTGAVSVDLAAYPFVGDQVTVASGGADGVPIADGTRTPNLHRLSWWLDGSGAWGPAYAWVQAAGTCLGAGCTSTNSTDPGTANAANYPTVYRAMLGCQAFNNARGHNDEAGCVVRLRAGTYPSFETSYSYSTGVAAQYTGAVWATVEAAPGETPATVVIGTGSYPLVRDRWRFRGVGFLPGSATASLAAHAILQGPDSTPANPVTTEVLFDGCTLTTRTAYPLLYGVGLAHFLNSTLDQSAGQGYLAYPYSTQRFAAGVVAGNTLRGANTGNSGSAVGAIGLVAGNLASGTIYYPIPSTAATFVQPTGPINLANKWMATVVAHDLRSLGWPANYAAVQNVYEKTGTDGQLGYGLLNDGDLTPFANVVRQHETVVGDPTGSGGRTNIIYNDTGAGAVTKQGVALFNLDQNRNTKRDTFDNPGVHQQPGRVGAWAWDAAVGHLGNVAGGTVGPNTNCTASSACWIGEFLGPLGLTNASLGFANNQSVSPNTGGGDYHLAAGSPAANRVPAGLAALPFDLGGTARRNDGTGAAGAFEGGG